MSSSNTNVIAVDFRRKQDSGLSASSDAMARLIDRLVKHVEDIETNPAKYLQIAVGHIEELHASIAALKEAAFPSDSFVYQPDAPISASVKTIMVYEADYKRWRAMEDILAKM